MGASPALWNAVKHTFRDNDDLQLLRNKGFDITVISAGWNIAAVDRYENQPVVAPSLRD